MWVVICIRAQRAQEACIAKLGGSAGLTSSELHEQLAAHTIAWRVLTRGISLGENECTAPAAGVGVASYQHFAVGN